jgi:hypothetical protein
MLGKLSIFAVAGIFMIPTTLTAQMGGAVNPGLGAAFNRGAAIAGGYRRWRRFIEIAARTAYPTANPTASPIASTTEMSAIP